MPLLLTEALPALERESAHMHIESCAKCQTEWSATREAWRRLGDLPEVRVPSQLRSRFLAHAASLQVQTVSERPADNVVAFRQRPAFRWVAQAAMITALVGGSFFVGQKSGVNRVATDSSTLASNAVSSQLFNISESAVVPASNINPNIQGRPDIANVRFFDGATDANEIGVAFDVTQHVTVKGAPNDKNMVKLLSYFLQNRDATTTSRSNAVQWVRDQYATSGVTDPELVKALANVLKNDTQEGVRIKAVDALKSLSPGTSPELRNALVDALKNDPNPAVRIKAVEALANMAKTNPTLDPSALETLRQKASQNDENPYVRVKAAEALSSLNL
jgi:hypothetical protein